MSSWLEMRKFLKRPRPVRRSSIALVHGEEHVLGDVGKGRRTTIVVVEDARSRAGARLDYVICLVTDPQLLAVIVVEHQVDAFHIGKVGDDIPLRNGNQSLLHLTRMHELHRIEQTEIPE
jgi:hypothetical protein